MFSFLIKVFNFIYSKILLSSINQRINSPYHLKGTQREEAAFSKSPLQKSSSREVVIDRQCSSSQPQVVSLRALCIVQLGGGGGGTTLCRHAHLQLGDGFVEVVRIDQWGARHTRADHNAHCCRRAVRPHLPPRVR